MKRTKMILALFLISIFGMTFSVTPIVAVSDDPVVGAVGSDVVYDHLAPAGSVKETITTMGGGTWMYSYTFTNMEPLKVWHFGVWTTFPYPVGHTDTTPFVGWNAPPLIPADYHTVTAGNPYDGRNLDAAIVGFSHTWSDDWGCEPPGSAGVYAVAPGATISGFSFKATVYDESPKWFYYEDVNTWAQCAQTPWVTAVGQTEFVPSQPAPLFSDILAMLPLGIVAAVVVIRRRRKYN